jgi:hypothetical protein
LSFVAGGSWSTPLNVFGCKGDIGISSLVSHGINRRKNAFTGINKIPLKIKILSELGIKRNFLNS